MMSPTNGHGDDDKGPRIHDTNANEMLAMEMESLHPGSTTVRKQQTKQAHILSQIWMLIKLHIESYPKIFSVVGLVGLVLFMYVVVEWSKPPLARHKVTQDYSEIQEKFDWKASQVEKWCLFGADDACSCEDFSEPLSREEIAGWMPAHEANKERFQEGVEYDVVFLGDDVIEEMNGKWLNRPSPGGTVIADDFKKTFSTEEDPTNMEGVALGIVGDSSANLLWRIHHGEVPNGVNAKVWWISIGSNDFARGGCSEEATVLGILHVAETVASLYPLSRVVIQGILPRSLNGDGYLSPTGSSGTRHFFSKRHSESYYADQARKNQQLWPSIQHVNLQLMEFCKKHPTIVYVDVNALFVGSVANALYKSKSVQIVPELMPRYDGRLSLQGHQKLHKVIVDELIEIIEEENDANDVVDKDGYDVVDKDTNEIDESP